MQLFFFILLLLCRIKTFQCCCFQVRLKNCQMRQWGRCTFLPYSGYFWCISGASSQSSTVRLWLTFEYWALLISSEAYLAKPTITHFLLLCFCHPILCSRTQLSGISTSLRPFTNSERPNAKRKWIWNNIWARKMVRK